jgi:hypothetical protein
MITASSTPAASGAKVIVLDEPELLFGASQCATDPHDGLGLFGPFSLGQPPHPRSPAYMVVGAPEGIVLFGSWARALNRAATVADLRKHRIWPPYPGFEAAFGSQWADQPALTHSLDRDRLLEASRKRDPHERCYAVVELVLEAFQRVKKVDANVGVAVCVAPDEVWTNCRPKSYVAAPSDKGISRAEKEARKQGQKDLFIEYDPEQYQLSPDFRRQLKARTMQFDVPLQILRESTLRLSDEVTFGARRLTPLSDRMWNIGTALYYKCGGKPWKLRSARDGVCYIGIAFRLADGGKRTACCAAQMFLDSGDGIVFLGEYGPWYSPESKQFHLSKAAAENLLRGVLQTYADLEGRPLREVFLHSRSSISQAEFDGYRKACPPGCKLVGVRVRAERNGPRLYRDGEMPVLRGTFWRITDRSGYLYAAGFKPRLATYDGWETPVPLRIDVQHGEAPIELVASDILGLTKLNYNACRLGESQPVTVRFSDAVGEILISNPTVSERRPNFKYFI